MREPAVEKARRRLVVFKKLIEGIGNLRFAMLAMFPGSAVAAAVLRLDLFSIMAIAIAFVCAAILWVSRDKRNEILLWSFGAAAWVATFMLVFHRSSIVFSFRPENEFDSWRWAASTWTVAASIWWGLGREEPKKVVLIVSYILLGAGLAFGFAKSASLVIQSGFALALALIWLIGDWLALKVTGATTPEAESTLQAVLFLDLPAVAGTLLLMVFAWQFETGQHERMAAFVSGGLAFQLLAAKVGFFALEWSRLALRAPALRGGAASAASGRP